MPTRILLIAALLVCGTRFLPQPGHRSTLVVESPEQLPGLAAVGGALPVPRERVGGDVVEHHALALDLRAGRGQRRREQALVAVGAAGEREEAALVVGPGLVPLAGRIAHAQRAALELLRRLGRVHLELLLDDLAVEDARDMVACLADAAVGLG